MPPPPATPTNPWSLSPCQRDKNAFLWGGGPFFKTTKKSQGTLGFGGYKHNQLIPIWFNWETIGSANSGKRNTLGFGGYRQAHFIPISFNWEPKVILILGKKSPWGFVITYMLTWYQSPQFLIVQGETRLDWAMSSSSKLKLGTVKIRLFCCFITQLVKELQQWSLYEVIEDIWLLSNEQNSFGYF